MESTNTSTLIDTALLTAIADAKNLKRQKFEIIYINDDGDIILTDNITALKSCTIQEIIENQSIDLTSFSVFIGTPQYGNNGALENTKIEPQYFGYTIENLNLWHPSDSLQLIICNKFI
jgi:hypothetical protein